MRVCVVRDGQCSLGISAGLNGIRQRGCAALVTDPRAAQGAVGIMSGKPFAVNINLLKIGAGSSIVSYKTVGIRALLLMCDKEVVEV